MMNRRTAEPGALEALNLLQMCLDVSNENVIKTVLQMLGQNDKLVGTMGDPVILADEAKIVKLDLEETFYRTLGRCCGQPPYTHKYLMKRAWAKYLLVFSWRD